MTDRGAAVPGPISRLLVAGLVSECVLLGAAFALGWLTGVAPFERSHPTLLALGYGVVATLPLLGLLRWCLRTGWEPIRRLVALVQEHLSPYVAGTTTSGVVLLSLMAGICEEALFRGVVQAGLSERAPAPVALAVAALLFGAAHWLTPTYAVLAGLIGAYLGVLFLVTDNLLVPIVTHTLYDIVALSVLVRMEPPAAGAALPSG